MPPAPIPENEQARLEAVRSLGVLDSETEEDAFDAIARSAAMMFDVPNAGISLIDDSREWFKASVGGGACEGARSTAFCAHTILSSEVLVIEDARTDERFRDNPKVTEGGVRFYAGAPIVLSTGEHIGAMYVRDSKPRTFGHTQREILRQMARSVSGMLEYRRDSILRSSAEFSERQLRLLLDDGAIVSVTDPDGTITHVNDMFCSISGYSRDELIGANHRVVKSGVHPDAFWRNMYRTVSRGRTWKGVIQNRSKSGDPYWVQSVIRGIHDQHGALRQILAIRFDITDLRLAVRRLRSAQRAAVQHAQSVERAESLLNRVGEMSRTGGWELDIASSSLTWTEETYRIVEYDGEAPPDLEQAISAYVPEAENEIRAAVQRCILDGEQFDMELPFVTARGRDLTVRAIGEAVELNGKITHLVGSIQDITQQKKAMEELTTTRQRLDLALTAAQEGLWDWNLLTDEVYFNDVWFTMLGYEPSELPMTLQTWELLCHPEDVGNAYTEIRRHQDGETDRYVCEQRLKRKDGSWAWILDVGEVVERDASGKPTRMIGVHIDISDQKQVQSELAEARVAAEAASDAKSGFLANMSHELRTPLTSIIGFSEILGDDIADIDGVKKAAGIISTNAKHLLTLINDILDLSKIESDRIEFEPIECSPRQFLSDLDLMMRQVAEAKGIAFETEVEYPVAETVKLDEVRVRQILVNLAGNAVKFTSEGRVRVSLVCRPDDEGQTALTVHVEDTGIGMDKACVERIFRPFMQGELSSTRRFGGTGLGLSISKRLAEMMDGRIEVMSTPGKGSRFTLIVPLGSPEISMIDRDAQTSANIEPSAIPERHKISLEGARILLVEDGVDNQKLLNLLLTKAGAEVVIASDGLEGADAALKAKASDTPFDLVLMDMQMPVLDGYGATRKLREAGFTTPVVALTAYATSEDRAKCLDAGCDDFLTKPIARKDLIDRCEAWIGQEPQYNAKAA